MAISQPEFQIPLGETNAPSSSELAASYIADAAIRRNGTERPISPESQALHSIRLSIEGMRAYVLENGLAPARNSSSVRDYIRKTLSQLVVPVQKKAGPLTVEHLINQESKIGGSLFLDDAPIGIDRRFFFHDDWFFSDTAVSSKAKPFEQAIRYQVLESGIYKIVDGKNHHTIEGVELERLIHVANLYHVTLQKTIYKHVPTRSNNELTT